MLENKHSDTINAKDKIIQELKLASDTADIKIACLQDQIDSIKTKEKEMLKSIENMHSASYESNNPSGPGPNRDSTAQWIGKQSKLIQNMKIFETINAGTQNHSACQENSNRTSKTQSHENLQNENLLLGNPEVLDNSPSYKQ
jgi:hypothetical protein